jgi:hypothetical protein
MAETLEYYDFTSEALSAIASNETGLKITEQAWVDRQREVLTEIEAFGHKVLAIPDASAFMVSVSEALLSQEGTWPAQDTPGRHAVGQDGYRCLCARTGICHGLGSACARRPDETELAELAGSGDRFWQCVAQAVELRRP